ncbi:SDR family NAD(P)-dependent oxidoreductase [Streptomyces sp. Tu 3180]|uniref:SDR family NAD(P)-dependent oxidoreductase n=1 Tax=Streptomyces sp. Tu 3180 TaxID=2682611 RepID=UPI00135B5D50|nr:SDR family NAD(P)-dependent oxidoreductase [Streptomyces sp. Tu 3180]KAF3469306.1 SDR family NAD(P)-dependent oxidoreductase [Streptomyces sp. Tu 3180]
MSSVSPSLSTEAVHSSAVADCFYSTAWVEAEGPSGVSRPGPRLLLSDADVDADLPGGWVNRAVRASDSLGDVLAEQAWSCVAVLSDGREADVPAGLRVLQACSQGVLSSPSRVVFLPAPGAADDAGLWGLARTARLERPDLAVHCIEAPREQLSRALTLSRSDRLEEDYRFTRTGVLEVPRLRRHFVGDEGFAARPDATYVVSGGSGALGLVAAEFLAHRGARHVVLLSRSARPGSPVPPAVAELRRSARVEWMTCDVSDPRSVRRARDAIAKAGMPAVAGVVHAAGVLADGMLAHQSEQKLRQAYGAKVDGAKNLRSVFAPPDFLVLFSSAASLFGAAGQASHAAANATLDALAESWSLRGEPVLSIQWGAWSDAGIAVRHGAVERARTAGFGAIGNDLGATALNRLLAGPERGVVCVSPLDWDTLSLRSRFVSRFTTRQRTDAPAPPPALGDVEQVVRTAARAAVGRHVEDDTSLADSGLDSLGSVLLRNRIASDLEVVLPPAFAVESADVRSLVGYIFEQLRSRSSEGAATRHEPASRKPASRTRTAAQPPASPRLPVLVIGAGLGGLGFARRLERLGVAAMILEKRDRVGGVWSSLANADSKVQIDSPAYSFDSASPAVHGDHRWRAVFPGRDEVLQQSNSVASELKAPIHFNCEVVSVRKVREQEYEAVYLQRGVTKSVRVSGVAALTGGLHLPVRHRFRDEHLFAGHVGLGVADDTPPEKFKNASVAIVGHGAFALENMRTALENGARHVTIICRRRNLVVSTLCNWLINSSEGATPLDDVVDIMRPFYDLCGIDIASLPSLSREADGSFVLDQSTVPAASDVYFLAQALGKVTVMESEIDHVSARSVVTESGTEVEADVLVKCLGSHTDRSVLTKIFGEDSRVEGLWIDGDPNLFTYNDGAQIPRKAKSLLCSSYVFFLQAFAEAYLHFRDNPAELKALFGRIAVESSEKSSSERLLVELWDFIERAKKNVASRTAELCPFDRFQKEREAEWRAYSAMMGGTEDEGEGLWSVMSPTVSLLHRRDPAFPVERRVQHDGFGPMSIFVPRRHRVLFLPGRGTDGRLSRAMLKKAGWTRREDLEFVIPDAPYAMPAFTGVEQLNIRGLDSLAEEGLYDLTGTYREWKAGFSELWDQYHDTPAGLAPADADAEESLNSALQYLRAVAEEHGPFAGVAGFGEGAAMASAALHRQARGREVGLGDVRFFIAMSAWRSPAHERAGIFEKPRPLDVPVLQTLGEREAEVFQAAAPVFGRDFRQVFEHRHLGKHAYPSLTRGLDHKLNRLLHAAFSPDLP